MCVYLRFIAVSSLLSRGFYEPLLLPVRANLPDCEVFFVVAIKQAVRADRFLHSIQYFELE